MGSLLSEKEARFSIYNAKDRKTASSLDFVRGDDTAGWNAQRNLLKCLNHLELLQKKEKISEMLLLHNTKTQPEVFKRNYHLLGDHQAGKITTERVIDQIANRMSLSSAEVQSSVSSFIELGHLEFHPSDICNLKCTACTYGHDSTKLRPKKICFPFDELEKLAIFTPKSILLSGGGEPTLYSDTSSGKRYTFADLIVRLRELMPNVRLALVTNGTHRVPGNDWTKHLDWIRVSIDAATAETYGEFRGKIGLYDRVLNNLLFYLETPVRYVGASFLFSQANIAEYAVFAKTLFDLVSEQAPQHLHKFNLQYRPLRKDPKDEGREFPAAITDGQIRKTISTIAKMAESSPDFANFLKDQTNIEAVLGGNTHPPHDFSRCHYSSLFHIVRANGEIRPCFIRVVEPDFVLGNICRDKTTTISLNSLYIAASGKKYCDPYGCRQCHLNYLLEAGLKGKILPSKSQTVANDPFF